MDRRTLRTRSSRLALLLLLVVAGATAFVHQQRLSFAPPARLSLSAAAAAAAAASRRPAVAAGWTPSSSTGSTSTSSSSHRTGLSLPSFPRRHQSRRWAAVAGGGAAGTGGNDVKEKVLATVRSLYFPLTVLGAGVLGAWRPAVYAGLSEGFVTRALAAVMVRAWRGFGLGVDWRAGRLTGLCIHTRHPRPTTPPGRC